MVEELDVAAVDLGIEEAAVGDRGSIVSSSGGRAVVDGRDVRPSEVGVRCADEHAGALRQIDAPPVREEIVSEGFDSCRDADHPFVVRC